MGRRFVREFNLRVLAEVRDGRGDHTTGSPSVS